MPTSFFTTRLDHGVAIVTLDVPGEPVNTLFPELADALDRTLAELDRNGEVNAYVFTSGKPDTFIAGAKIDLFEHLRTAEQATALAKETSARLGKLESSKKPVVVAIHGACLGGGLEFALACRYRVASDDPKTKLGLPEVQLGLLPGAGGTQRLPRLIGLAPALDLLLTGKQLRPSKARKLGVVDEVVPKSILLDVAVRRARALADGSLKLDRSKPREPVRVGNLGNSLQKLALEDNPVGRAILFREARKSLLAKTHGHYPAPERILDVVKVGASDGFAAGLEAEAKAFGELVMTDVSRQLVSIFFATTALKKDNGVDDAAVKALPVSKVGIVGAGLMGAGIAYVSIAQAGHEVRLKDRDDAGVGRGLATLRGLLDGAVKKKRITTFERDRQLGAVSGGTDWSGFQRADVVIEAVFEDLALKHRVIQELEAVIPERCIVATNTSSLPIAKIAAASTRPERVVGMHYFSPVDKMPLLEVIEHPRTAKEVTATAVAIGKAQGKTVIVVKDGVGFYTSRILAPYMNECAYLLGEGAKADELDDALVAFGFPVGPVALLDEVGIDVGEKVGHIMVEAFGDRMKPPPGNLDAFAKDGRLGRKTKKGFYRYDGNGKSIVEGGKKALDLTAYDLLPHGRNRKSFPKAAMAERLALLMVNEAVLCLQDGILRSPRDGDIGAIFGLGFPPFRGGPFRYIDACGAGDIVKRLEALENTHGPRFTAAGLLVDHARSGNTFHP